MSAIFYRKILSRGYSCASKDKHDSQARIVVRRFSKSIKTFSSPNPLKIFMLLSYGLSFIVALFIHELGHLFAARACGVPVSEFGLGWGRRVWGFRFAAVEYKLHALPI